ncbi:hypothetical protein [Micromonospora orduensis]|uniref:hypothetical protein n=1 Tax=Micromonospora orduensis TaxID=1420891 RepID=UPI0033D7F947
MSELRDGGVPDQCFICGRLTLGLIGQDCYLAPYMLGQDRSFTDDRFGQCHLKCLQESGLSRKWAAGVADYFCERWPDFVELDGGGRRVHGNFPAKSLVLWSIEGWFATLPFSSLRSLGGDSAPIEAVQGRRLVGVTSVVGFEDGPYEAIFGGLRSGRQEHLDLISVLAEIGTLEQILDPRLVKDGRIERVPSKNVALGDEYQAGHFIEIADDVFDACTVMVNRAPAWKRRRR